MIRKCYFIILHLKFTTLCYTNRSTILWTYMICMEIIFCPFYFSKTDLLWWSSWSGPWFRLSAISYPEVLDPQQAVKELSGNRILSVGYAVCFLWKLSSKVDRKFVCDVAATGYTSCFEITNEPSDDDIKEILNLLTVPELREILCILRQVGI